MNVPELPSETPKRSRKARWRRLETHQDVRLALAAMVRQMRDGKIDPDVGRACIYGLRSLNDALRDTALEERLRLIEERLRQ
jgi:hypothetical protein